MKTTKLEALFWSIAFPGFGQLLNGHIIKGITFIILELLINVYSNFNTAIMLSFNGNISGAIKTLNFQWIMFYPCIYMFAMYDAYKFGSGKYSELSFLPFVFAAYFVTVGVMFSTTVNIFKIFPGPIFLPMIALIPGISIGFLVRAIILSFRTKHKKNTQS
ncbi:hypothetical protein [Metabacillus fastidiosus]|uniref:hypothetical protein n=1 Tax=Metabacillus fastidiosus TaxID=1458 RepID=UPI003D2C6078